MREMFSRPGAGDSFYPPISKNHLPNSQKTFLHFPYFPPPFEDYQIRQKPKKESADALGD